MKKNKEEDLFHGLNLRPLPKKLLLGFHRRYSFRNKRIMEIGSDLNLQLAQAMLRLGAVEVVAVNPHFEDQSDYYDAAYSIKKSQKFLVPVEPVMGLRAFLI